MCDPTAICVSFYLTHRHDLGRYPQTQNVIQQPGVCPPCGDVRFFSCNNFLEPATPNGLFVKRSTLTWDPTRKLQTT